MRRFQYKTLNAFTDDELNALGADGWELVAVVERRAYLKRELTVDDLRLAALLEEHKDDPPILAGEPIKRGERIVYFKGAYRPAIDKYLCDPQLVTATPYIYAVKDVLTGEPVEFSFTPVNK